MNCTLWGPNEQIRDSELADLLRRLESLGLSVACSPLGAPPPVDARVVVVNSKTRIGERELGGMPELALIVTATSGYDHIDLEGAKRRGIRVVRCPLARRDAVVDMTLALGLSLLRRLPVLGRAAATGHWMRAEMKQVPIGLARDMTVGIFGHGVIGRRAEQVWSALGAEVLVSDPAYPGLTTPRELLERSNIITLHCSLTDSSRNLIDAAALARMQPGTIVLNTARGESIDLDDLCADSRLGGIGLDVFAEEPYPRLAELAARDNVILTPHSAGYHEALGLMVNDEVETALAAWLADDPLEYEVTRD